MTEPTAFNEFDPAITVLPSQRPGSWPVAIGVIAVVFGAGGMLGGFFGMFAPLFNDFMASLDPNQAAVYEAQAKYQWFGVALSAAMLVVASLLLWGGIVLLNRRPTAAGWLKNWAVAKIVLTVVLTGYQAVLLPESMDASFQAQQQQGGTAVPEFFTQALVIVSVVMTLLWGTALPVFMLIWLGRKKVKDEVASWADTATEENMANQTW